MARMGDTPTDGAVVRMGGGAVSSLVPRAWPAAAQVEGYWNAIRGARALPDRAEIDPRGIEAALPDTMLLDPVAPRVARFRVAGRHLEEIIGMEPRGMPLSVLFRAEARAALGDVLEEVGAGRAVAALALQGERGLGRPALSAYLWLAPLGCGQGGGVRMLGCLETSGKVGAAPRRFLIERVALSRIDAGGQWAPCPDALAPAAAGPARDGEATRAATRPALRIVSSRG